MAIKYAANLVEPSGGTVAEIGCGEGYLMPTLRKHFDKVVGVDKSEKMLNSAKMFYQFTNVFYLIDNITSPKHLQLIEEKYNWIICLETLEHIPQWDIALYNKSKNAIAWRKNTFVCSCRDRISARFTSLYSSAKNKID